MSSDKKSTFIFSLIIYSQVTSSLPLPRYGLDSIPEDWLAKYDLSDEVIGYLADVVKAN